MSMLLRFPMFGIYHFFLSVISAFYVLHWVKYLWNSTEKILEKQNKERIIVMLLKLTLQTQGTITLFISKSIILVFVKKDVCIGVVPNSYTNIVFLSTCSRYSVIIYVIWPFYIMLSGLVLIYISFVLILPLLYMKMFQKISDKMWK